MSTPPSVTDLQQQLAAAQQQAQQQSHQYHQAHAAAQQELVTLRAQLASSPGSSSSPPANAGGHHASARIDLKPMQPSAFTGTASSNAEQWLVELERYFLVVNLGESDPRRAQLASTYLKDAASGWYASQVKEPTFGASPSWALFKERFLARFRPLAASRMARIAIRNLRCRHRVAGYAQEFQKQMQLIPDMSVADQLEFFISGLPEHIAQETDRERPETLSDAMEAAQRVELMMTSRRAANGRPSYGRTVPYMRGGGGTDAGDRMDLSAMYGPSADGGADADFSYDYYDRDDGAFSSQYVNFMSHRGRGGQGMRPSRGGRGGQRSGHAGPEMSQEKFDKLSKAGLCFHCEQPGHLARNCPKKAQKSSN
jgi:hypothetical protein